MLTVRTLIQALDELLDRHGDLPIQVYNNSTDDTGRDVIVEFDDADDPVVMINYYPDDDS